MYLVDSRSVPAVTEPVVRLTIADLEELESFYSHDAYTPDETEGRFFAPYMLQHGPFFGIRREERLVAAGGVHVVSKRYRVAALANVATAPAHRRRGFATALTATLCKELSKTVDLIGLNVDITNKQAIRCYENLGFEHVGRYIQGVLTRR